jgi:hypothetical protein
MKPLLHSLKYKAFLFIIVLADFQTGLFAQSTKVSINGNDVGSWFGRNWLWVAGIMAFLVLIILFSRGSSRNSRTTTVTDSNGNIRRTTTTEIDD